MNRAVFVKLFAFARESVGKAVIELSFYEDMTINDLLRRLKAKFPQLGPVLFNDNGNLKSDYSIFVNEIRVEKKQFDKYRLKPGDTVFVYPPVGGG